MKLHHPIFCSFLVNGRGRRSSPHRTRAPGGERVSQPGGCAPVGDSSRAPDRGERGGSILVNNKIFPLIFRWLGVGPVEPVRRGRGAGLSNSSGSSTPPVALIHGFSAGHKTLTIGAWLLAGLACAGTPHHAGADRRTRAMPSAWPRSFRRCCRTKRSWCFRPAKCGPMKSFMCPKPSLRPAWPCWSGWPRASPRSSSPRSKRWPSRSRPAAVLQEQVRTIAVGDMLPMEQLGRTWSATATSGCRWWKAAASSACAEGCLDVFPIGRAVAVPPRLFR